MSRRCTPHIKSRRLRHSEEYNLPNKKIYWVHHRAKKARHGTRRAIIFDERLNDGYTHFWDASTSAQAHQFAQGCPENLFLT